MQKEDLNLIHPSAMTVGQFVSYYSVKHTSETTEQYEERVYEAAGIGALRCFAAKQGMGAATKSEAREKHGESIQIMVSRGLLRLARIIVKVNTSHVSQLSKPANYVDAFDRVANIGLRQKLIYYTPKMREPSEDIIQVKTYLNGTQHTITSGNIEKLENTFVVVATHDDQVKGIATSFDGNLDYSKNGTGLAPVEFASHGPGTSKLADLFSSFVTISENVMSAVGIPDTYLSAGQMSTKFTNPKSVFRALAATVIELYNRHGKSQPSVSGTGKAIQKWMYDFIKYIFSTGDERSLDALKFLSKTWNSSIKAKGDSMMFDKNKTGVLICAFAPLPFSMSRSYDGQRLMDGHEASFSVAKKSLVDRRKLEHTGSTGISGINLGYAVGLNLPERVLDVLCFAADIKDFVKAYPNEIKVDIIDGKKMEAVLRALVYLKYEGKVWINDRREAVKLAKANDINKNSKHSISGHAKEFKFGKSLFTIHTGYTAPEVPAICYAHYEFNKHFANDEEFVKHCVYKRNEIRELITSKIYLLNVPLIDDFKGEGVYQSLEAHNLWGWETNSSEIIEKIKGWEKKLAAFYLNKEATGYFVQPFTDATYKYAYGRALVANISRAQYIFTGMNFISVCQVANLPLRSAPLGDLSGIVSDVIMINGSTIETLIGNAELRALLESEGNDEIKHVVRMYEGFRPEVKREVEVSKEEEASKDDMVGGEAVIQKLQFDEADQ